MKWIIILSLSLITLLFVPKNLTAQGCLTADVMILMDWSGSEHGNEQRLALAASMFVSELPIDDNQLRVGILAFSSSIKSVVDLTGNKEKLLNEIAALALTEASGGTYIEPAILYAGHLLNNKRQVPKIIIIISDGEIYDVNNGVIQIEYYKSIMPLFVHAVKVSDYDNYYEWYSIEDIKEREYSLNKNLMFLVGKNGIVEFSLPTEIVQALKKLNLCG